MWLGPRPERPYQENIAPYKFRWWQLYSSQMGNWGVHYLDAIRWLTGELAPASVCAMGGRFAVDDDRTIPDTLEATFEFASGRLAVFGQYEASGNPALPLRARSSCAARRARSTSAASGLRGRARAGRPVPGPRAADGADEEVAPTGSNRGPDRRCTPATSSTACKSREKPNADVEIGHRSTTFSLLANISLDSRPAAGLGRRDRSRSPTPTRPTSCCTTSTASRGSWGERVLRGPNKSGTGTLACPQYARPNGRTSGASPGFVSSSQGTIRSHSGGSPRSSRP